MQKLCTLINRIIVFFAFFVVFVGRAANKSVCRASSKVGLNYLLLKFSMVLLFM